MNNLDIKSGEKQLESNGFRKPIEVDNYIKSILERLDGVIPKNYPFPEEFLYDFTEILQDGDRMKYLRKDIPIFNHLSLDAYKVLPREGNGTWDGEKGNSRWIPDPDTVPDPENGKGGNPESKSWREILKKYGVEGIVFKDGEPDFSPFAIAEVGIVDFSTNRTENFQKADYKCAEQWNKEGKDGKTNWTARDVADYRKENGYTWHECSDCKTMQLVPKEIHNNTPHSGGIAEMKKQERAQ